MGNIAVEKTSLAAKFATDAPYIAAFSADPGTTGAATNELTGGTYARVAASWVAGAAGVQTATCNLNVPAGSALTHIAACASGTAGTADLKDRVAVTWTTNGTAAIAQVTATFTQT